MHIVDNVIVETREELIMTFGMDLYNDGNG